METLQHDGIYLNAPYQPTVVEAYVLDACKRATTLIALKVSRWRGKRKKKNADLRATLGGRAGLNKYLPIPGICVIGEGKLDEAPMLKIGEKLGPEKGDHRVLIGADVIDGTDSVATNTPGGIAVIIGAIEGEGSLMATEHEGHMWHFVFSPLVMEKWVYCQEHGVPEEVPGFRPDLSPFDQPLETVMRFVAWASEKKLSYVCVGMLDRKCNDGIFNELQSIGVECTCPSGGSVALALNTQDHAHELDVFLGRGGSPEAVMAAVCVRVGRGGGWFKWYTGEQGKDEVERQAIIDAGFDPDKIYAAEELAQGHVFISISSITGTDSLAPVKYNKRETSVQTYYGRSRTGTHGIQTSCHLAEDEIIDNVEDIPED